MALQEEAGTQKDQEEGDGHKTPFEELSDRISEKREELDGVWERFSEQANANGHFRRGGSIDSQPDASLPGESSEDRDVLSGESQVGQQESEPLENGFDEETALGPLVEEPTETEIEAPQGAGQPEDDLFEEADERLEPDEIQQVNVDDREFVVPKKGYCEQCPHMSDPPQVSCTNQGTDILEFVDMDRVRVRDCPVVEERQIPDDLG